MCPPDQPHCMQEDTENTAPTPPNIVKMDYMSLPRTDINDILGWLSNPSTLNHCEGYYLDEAFEYPRTRINASGDNPLYINAINTEFSQVGTSTLLGNVVISEPARQVRSDVTYLNRDPDTNAITSADLYGHVYLREPGKLVIGDKAHINLVDKSGSLYNSLYRMTLIPMKKQQNGSTLNLDAPIEIEGLTAWGTAKKVMREPSGIVRIYKGTYTTCPPTDHAWMVKANTLRLDKTAGRGTATGSRLYIHDTPIMYLPYFNFPLDDRRETGFLFPSFGGSTETGFSFALPFYWNIAPNYDATITPNYMQIRGLQMNGEFRYLTPSSDGNIHGSILPNDSEFEHFKKEELERFPPHTPGLENLENASNTRSFVSMLDNRRYGTHWASHLYLNHASDYYYFTDFDSDPAQVTNNQIVNEGYIAYTSEHWNFMGRAIGYQTLHPTDQIPVDNQYRKLPGLILNGHYPEGPSDTDIQLQNSFDNFDRTPNPRDIFNIVENNRVTGTRLNVNPIITFPLYWLAGYINPQIQLEATQYNLNHQLPTDRANVTRVLPIVDVDAGLFFEKNIRVANTDYQQTLEPRLYYLYVPYVNQSDIPIFDTGLQPFTFGQLFRTNRFSGIDRIADANQISLALTTRFLTADTGEEKVRASVGEIVYFRHRMVNVTRDLPTLDSVSRLDLVSRTISLPIDTPTSPLVGEVTYHINKEWLINTSAAWDPNFNRTNNANFAFQYKLDDQRVVNLGYNYLRGGDAFMVKPIKHGDALALKQPNTAQNDLNQTNLSFIWPINNRWSGLGRWNYNLSHGYTQNLFGGIQYDSCCWAVRLIAGHEFNYLSLNDNTATLISKNTHTKPIFDNKVYLEFALKGLGNLANRRPRNMLGEGIIGYKDNFGGFY